MVNMQDGRPIFLANLSYTLAICSATEIRSSLSSAIEIVLCWLVHCFLQAQCQPSLRARIYSDGVIVKSNIQPESECGILFDIDKQKYDA